MLCNSFSWSYGYILPEFSTFYPNAARYSTSRRVRSGGSPWTRCWRRSSRRWRTASPTSATPAARRPHNSWRRAPQTCRSNRVSNQGCHLVLFYLLNLLYCYNWTHLVEGEVLKPDSLVVWCQSNPGSSPKRENHNLPRNQIGQLVSGPLSSIMLSLWIHILISQCKVSWVLTRHKIADLVSMSSDLFSQRMILSIRILYSIVNMMIKDQSLTTGLLPSLFGRAQDQ